MDPAWRQMQKVLQRAERHEHQTSVHSIETSVKNPHDRVYVISHRTIGCLRQQDDFRAQPDTNRAGEFVSSTTTFCAARSDRFPLLI